MALLGVLLVAGAPKFYQAPPSAPKYLNISTHCLHCHIMFFFFSENFKGVAH